MHTVSPTLLISFVCSCSLQTSWCTQLCSYTEVTLTRIEAHSFSQWVGLWLLNMSTVTISLSLSTDSVMFVLFSFVSCQSSRHGLCWVSSCRVQRSLVLCCVSCMLIVVSVCHVMSFTSFVVLFHSFVYAHVCGLSHHFPFLFIVPISLAYSFIVSSKTPHIIIQHNLNSTSLANVIHWA